jgi:DNA-directed RNA polymerase specialized sigma24 family protein
MSVYTSISDQELVLLLKSGDERAYTEIYDRYSATLLVHAYHKLHDQEEAKDLVHELFMVLWSKKEALVIEKSLSAYLFMALKTG